MYAHRSLQQKMEFQFVLMIYIDKRIDILVDNRHG